MTFEESIAKIDNIVQSYLEEIDRRGFTIAHLRASNAELLAAAKEVRDVFNSWDGSLDVNDGLSCLGRLQAAISHVEESTS